MGFATGGYRIRPYDFTVIFGTKIITHYELRIDLIPHSEFYLLVFFSLAETIYVSVDAALNDLYRIVLAFYFIYDGLFALEGLIDCEEVRHFIENVLRKFGNVLVGIVCRVVERYCDYLIVERTVVEHRNYADRVAFYECERFDRLGAEDENIERVAVVGISTGDKTVVCRVVC